MKVTAKIKAKAFNVGTIREKEIVHGYKVIDLESDSYGHGPDTVADCRLYMGRDSNASVVYAVLWCMDGNCSDGTGRAGGYGYHKSSQAVANAIRNAGFVLDRDIGGVGDEAIREGLLAVAVHCGAKKPFLVEFYA